MRISKTNAFIIVLSLTVAGMAAAIYRQVSAEERVEALGDTSKLSEVDKVIFTDLKDGTFQEKTKPKPSEWLSSHEEAGQSFVQYLKSAPNLPDRLNDVIYIQPLGDFPKEAAPDLEVLLEYTKAYYHPMKVVMRDTIVVAKVKATERINNGQKQWLAGEILKWMYPKLPADAYSMLAVTMTDLYPNPEWNYVFGYASLKHRVGVFSFARYNDEKDTVVLKRAAKVLTHETGHMFGIKHCTFYQCNMNGSNHREEMDTTPMHLCPVCLRKMQHAVRFDVTARYEKLHEFYVKYDLDEEARWVGERLKSIQKVK